MPDKYYDVIVIGRSLGALAAAALLARRDFTVLVVGQGARSADYQLDNYTLRRRAFTMLAGDSPVWWRILGELAQGQLWKRRRAATESKVQVLLPDRRFELCADRLRFARAVAREFGDVRRHVADLYRDFARVQAAADSAFEKDAVWPPGTFMERRQTGRIASTLPYARAEPHADLLADFPRGHAYRHIVTETVRFATDLATLPPAFAMARLHAAWLDGVVPLEGGQSELESMLVARIEANGGVSLMDERVSAIEVKRGAVVGARLDGEPRAMGAGFVITDSVGEDLVALAGGRGISKKAQREWPRIAPSISRYVVSLVVRRAGVPEALGPEAILLADAVEGAPRSATIHLQRSPAGPDEVLLVAEVLRGQRESVPLADARAWVVRRLCQELPFLERHLLVVDSVHDGLPVWRYPSDGEAACRPVPVARTELSGAGSRSEAMQRLLEVDPPGYLGLSGEPIRGPIERSLLVGASVMPGLGVEGRLLAANSAARLVTLSDKRKARMRREMWTKLEIS